MSEAIEQVDTIYTDGLPTNWKLFTIADLVGEKGMFVDGDWVESKDQDPNGDVRLIQLADIGDGEYRNKSARFLTYEKALGLGCTFLKKEDILVARMPDPLGRACIFPGDEKKSVTAVDVAIVRPGNNEFSNRWLMYFINSPAFRSVVASMQSGSTRKRISRMNLARITLPVPPRKQQDHIVAEIEKQFSRLDEAVAGLKRVKANLRRYKSAVLKAAVEGKLTEQWRKEHPDVEPAQKLLERILTGRRKKWEESELARMRDKGIEPGDDKWKKNYQGPLELESAPREISPGWIWASFDALTNKVTSGSRAWKKYLGKGDGKFVLVQNIKERHLDLTNPVYVKAPEDQEAERTRVGKGDILITIVGNAGITTLVKRNIGEAYVSQSIALARPLPGMNLQYLEYYLTTPDWGAKFLKEKQYGMGRGHLLLSHIKQIPMALPPYEEQCAIVDTLDNTLSVIDELEREVDACLSRIDRLRQSILKKAFSGKLVPRDGVDSSSEA